jgi:Domain of unknown function (DUF4349)
MRRFGLAAFAFLAIAAVVGFVATGGLSGVNATGGSGTAGMSTSSMPAKGAPVTGPVAGDAFGAAPGSGTAATDEGATAGTVSTGPVGSIGGLPAIGAAVIKTASVDIQVHKGEFETAFDAAMKIASRYGGYVESSSSSGAKVHSGTLTIRVPSVSFQDAMNDLTGLGEVQSQSASGHDVTDQFIDLNARLRTWEAQEAVLLRLMKHATTIEATLRVQSNLQDVQFRIEQIKGQLRVLENQTELASIDVSLHEPGVIVHPAGTTKPDERPSLAEAWTKAVNGFVGVVYVTVVGLGYLVPIALICLAVWFGVRRARPAATPSS